MRTTNRAQLVRLGWLCLALVACAKTLPAAPRDKGQAPPPQWDRRVLDLFFSDARQQLGPRQASPASVARSETPARPAAPLAPSAPSSADDAFPWSTLISREALEDEVKNSTPELLEELRTATKFKSGGYQVARRTYSTLAAVFGVIALYDDEVRWKNEAAGMRDLLARAAANCKVASDAAFNEAKLRSDDLARMVRGGSVDVPEAEPTDDWPQVADRRPLMTRMEIAERDRLQRWVANENVFRQHQDELLHEAQVLALLSHLIEHEDYEFGDDATYREYTDELRRHSLQLLEAVRGDDLSQARESVGGITKSCNNCHGDFRS